MSNEKSNVLYPILGVGELLLGGGAIATYSDSIELSAALAMGTVALPILMLAISALFIVRRGD